MLVYPEIRYICWGIVIYGLIVGKLVPLLFKKLLDVIVVPRPES